MRCRSIGYVYSGLVHSFHQSDQSFSGNRSGCLCKHATANLRAKLKSPKLSSWEDCSPSRSAAINQKEPFFFFFFFFVKYILTKQKQNSSEQLFTISFAVPPFVLEPMHYQCLCKSSILHAKIKSTSVLRRWIESQDPFRLYQSAFNPKDY